MSLNDNTNEFNLPADATLNALPITYLLPTSTVGAKIPISYESCLRSPVDETKIEQSPTTRRYLLVGRQATTADLRIQHGSISRKHALLYYDHNHNCIVQDLGSKYGTTVNNQRLPDGTTYMLLHGDTIMFGNVRDNIFTVQRETDNTLVKIEEASREKDNSIAASTTCTSVVEEPATTVQDLLEKVGHGLSGRAKRQAEIAAMMLTLDETPTYKKVEETLMSSSNPNDNDHHLTIAESFRSENAKAMDVVHKLGAQHSIPISNRIVVESESERKNVPTCLSVDPVGSRFMVGCTDASLRLYDFGGMDQKQTRSFKSVIPDDGYWPVACAYSNTGDRILIGTGSVQPIVLDRDGDTVIKFVRGDMYVTDQSKTTGHTASVTGVGWHPFERDTVLTSSMDGSVRLWNLNGKTQFQMLVCDKVFQAKCIKGKRTAVLCVSFHPAGREFAVGTSCGSIQIWNRSKVSGRPERAVFAAHGNAIPISSLTYSYDGTKLASRSVQDSTVKVWNSMKMSQSSLPMVICHSAENYHEQANAAFSPDGKILCAGIASVVHEKNLQRGETGRLNFYDISNSNSSCDALFSVDLDLNVGAILVIWHPKVNQLFVGCSSGQVIVYFDPLMSRKGAIIASGKAGKRVDELTELLQSRLPKGSAAISGEIFTPLYNANLGHKRKRNDILEEVPSREPERPATGKHKMGGAASGGGLNFQQYVADKSMKAAKTIAGKDPREALFKYNEGKAFVDRAYEGNKSKLAEKTAEEDEEELKRTKQLHLR
jgi:WD repeat-containing protein 70